MFYRSSYFVIHVVTTVSRPLFEKKNDDYIDEIVVVVVVAGFAVAAADLIVIS